MDWNFGIVEVTLWTGMSAIEVLGLDDEDASASPFDDQPAPWIELGVLIKTDKDRLLSLHVECLDDFLRLGEYAVYPERRYYELLEGISTSADLYLAPWDEPSVLVDAPSFDWPLIDRLLFTAPEVRRRILWPCHPTEEEVLVLSRLEVGYSADDAIRHAIVALKERFGDPLRIEAQDADQAAQLLRDCTFLGRPTDLFEVEPGVFTPQAKHLLLDCWDIEEPF